MIENKMVIELYFFFFIFVIIYFIVDGGWYVKINEG